MKYILVTGGVISGVGKGVLASSIGTILKAGGIRVTSIKIDPYINIDAGTFSPYEHGKVAASLDFGKHFVQCINQVYNINSFFIIKNFISTMYLVLFTVWHI